MTPTSIAPDEAPRTTAQALLAARTGCPRSLNELAERYRRYLLLIANDSLSPALRAKVGASDLVQETLLHFQQRIGTFEGQSEEDLLHWLRRVLYYRALQAARTYASTAARDLRRETSLTGESASWFETALVDAHPTPCSELACVEEVRLLNAAIDALPDDARQIIFLRNLERWSFRDIGALLEISADAARKRWVRAIGQLRRQLNGHERP